MKKLLFLISFVLSINIAYAQQPAYLRGDVIHLTNVTKTTQVFVDGKIKILTALPGSSSDSVYSKGSDGFLHLIKAVVDTTRFLNLNQTTLQTIKGNVHGLRNLTIDSALNAGGNISAGGNLVVSGISAFGGFAEFYGGIQSPYQLIFNNSITAGNNWVAKNGNEASSATLQFIYGGSGTGIKMIGNNLYDLAGNAFLKSGSTAGHAGNADSLGSQLPSYYLNRANHTGTQAESTITNLVTDLGAKATLTQLGIKQPRVIATYTIGTNTSVTATDSVSSAFGKLQAEINSANTAISGKQATGNYITGVTGDGTASGPGSVAFTLATVNSNVFASNTFLKMAVNGKGLITGAVAVGSSDITGALGYTPYNNTNPSGFITAASPALTGTPTAPTQATADNSTAIATTAFVQANFAATVTYFTPGMFSGLGTSGSNFNWGTSTIPLSAFNVTGTPSSTTYLRGDGTWSTVSGSGFTNPMTTAGDIITATSGGTAARLGIGSANQVLGVNAAGTALEYKTATQGTGITITHGTGSITYAVDQTYSPSMTGNWIFSPTNGASSGTTYGTQINTTNNGTSTNGFTAFRVNITNNTNGSGGLNIADFLFNGVSKLSISSTGQILSSAGFNGGSITSGSYNQTAGTSTNMIFLTNYAPADATHQNLQSPSTIWNFPVWNTNATAAQNYVNWKQEARGTGGATPGSAWVLASSLTTTTTASYTDRLSLNGLTGDLTLSTGGLITNGHSTIEGVTSTGATGSGKFVFDASPALTGTPTVPTAAPGTNTTQAASTAFVTAAVTAGGGATYATPSALIGLTAIPGSATTGTRSDAAPALSQAIIPVWTQKHTFSITDAASSGTNFGTVISHTVNGTGTDGFSDFYVNRIENTTGSGGQYLARFAVNGSDKVQINNFGGITTTSSITLGGGVNSSGFFQTTGFNLMYFKNTATADATHTGLFGASWIDDYTAWNSSGTPAANYIQWKQEGRSIGGASPLAQWVWAESLSTTTTPSFGDKMILDGNSNLSGLNAVSLKHIIGTSGTPTIAAGTGAGTSPTISIGAGSTDSDGIINVTTGTSPTASGIIATITFSSAYGASPIVIISNGTNTFAALSTAQMPFCPARGQTNNPTTTTFVVQAGTTALPASTSYAWTYHVMQ